MRTLLAASLLLTCRLAFSQDIAELDRRNGFKTIHLGEPLDSIQGAEFKKDITEHDEFPTKLYQVENEEYNAIGEVKVKSIQIMTYKNLIYSIIVKTEKDPRVMKALEKSFGKGAYMVRSQVYKWGSDVLTLTFHANKHNIELIYRSRPVIQMMYDDKGKKLDAIAEGF